MRKQFLIPIYDADLWLVISDDIQSERKDFEKWFGPTPEGDHYNALCSYGTAQHFALFFEPAALTPKIIAHEVFHLTHRILDWSGVYFGRSSHEAAALLNGYLLDLIVRETQPIWLNTII